MEEAWHEVPLLASDPSALLINLGDLLQLWTRGAWHSPLHRVANTASTATTDTHLVSIVMFTGDRSFSCIILYVICPGPHADTELTPLASPLISDQSPRGRVITAGEHVLSKVNKTALQPQPQL